MKRFAQVVGVATGLSLALGTVAFTPTVATAESPFTTLGQFASGNARMAKPAWIASTGISKAAWNSALTDESVKVDETGRAFVIEPRATVAEISATTSNAAVVHTDIALADAFTLHSRPSSSRIIYLDFTGHDVTGSAWDDAATFGANSRTVPAYDADGLPATFNNTERQNIIDTWSAVVEDYAMFDVDVTTEEPAQSEIDRANLSDTAYGVRAVITDESNPIAANCGCGGIAYVGVYDYPSAYYGDVSYSPAFAFTRPSFNGKIISDIVSHEVGHNAGLVHDGFTPDEYYMGRNGWAPIMGAGYDEPLVQWSNGDYNSADNQEDDLAEMQAQGLPLLADDHGGTSGTATAVDVNSTTEGTIRLRSDVDYFSVVPAGNSFDVLVDLPSYSPNLDVQVAVFDSNGATIATANPNFSRVSTNSATGLGATATVSSTPGQTYYVKIDGVGFGSASSTGYSDYGSLGDYRVSITGDTMPTVAAGSPSISGSAVVGQTLTGSTGTWDAGVATETEWLVNNVETGDTDSTYTIQPADLGRSIKFRVTGTKSGFISSVATAQTSNVTSAAMTLTGSPSIAGTVVVGQTLTGSTGTWDAGTTLATLWMVNSSATSDTDSSYTIQPADLGKVIKFRVTATKSGYTTQSATAQTISVAPATITPTAIPTVTGVAKVGRRLNVSIGTWMSGTTLSTQWLRNGSVISGATGLSYKLKSADSRKRISVRVTGTKSGYSTVSQTSAASARVKS